MYNRYIPQSDGSFRRSRIPDPVNSAPRPTPRREPPQAPTSPQEERRQEDPPCHKGQPSAHTRPPRPYFPSQNRPQAPKDTAISHFLKQLLPKNFDTEDLLIIMLLLLMSGDCAEDQNTALLTLAIYLFL